MITLFTGTPGSGKTVLAVSELHKKESKSGRPIFVHGVPDLKIPHTKVICSSKACEVCPIDPKEREGELLAEEWNEWAPEGAFIILDEVQNVYRPRSSSSRVPDSVKAFETHRHKGIDFLLISQSPLLFDANIRQFVSKHVHLKANYARRIRYEWPECKNSVQSTTDAISSTYRLDKEVFKLFKSSELHTKINRKLPPALIMLPFLLLAVGAVAFYLKDTIQKKIQPEVASLPFAPASSVPSVASSSVDSKTVEPDFNRLSRVPAVKNQPETAPIYSDVLEVTDFPVIVGVIVRESTSECVAYTQQGTVYKTSQNICHRFYKGRIFNPYKTLLANNDPKKQRNFERERTISNPSAYSEPVLNYEYEPTKFNSSRVYNALTDSYH